MIFPRILATVREGSPAYTFLYGAYTWTRAIGHGTPLAILSGAYYTFYHVPNKYAGRSDERAESAVEAETDPTEERPTDEESPDGTEPVDDAEPTDGVASTDDAEPTGDGDTGSGSGSSMNAVALGFVALQFFGFVVLVVALGIGGPYGATSDPLDRHANASVERGVVDGVDLNRSETLLYRMLRREFGPETWARTGGMDSYASWALRQFVVDPNGFDDETRARAAVVYGAGPAECTPGHVVVDTEWSFGSPEGVATGVFRGIAGSPDDRALLNGSVTELGVAIGVHDGALVAIVAFC